MKTVLRCLVFSIIVMLAKVSTAQVGNCDSLQVLEFELNPFNTDQLVLRSAYSDFDNFISYPGFSVVDENLYILAQEEVNYFGMSTEQVHILEVFDLDIEAGETLAFDLELWSFFFEFLECVFPGPFVLWPEQECVPLRMTVNVFDSDLAGGYVAWDIFNEGGELLETNAFALDTMPELFHFDFCLPSGCSYGLNIETEEMVGSGMSYSLHYGNFLAVGANGTVTDAGENNHSFDLYNCLTTGKGEADLQKFSLYPNPGTDRVHLEFGNDELPHTLCVNDLTGREIVRVDNPKDRLLHLDCSHWPPGIYLVSVVQRQKEVVTAKLVITR